MGSRWDFPPGILQWSTAHSSQLMLIDSETVIFYKFSVNFLLFSVIQSVNVILIAVLWVRVGDFPAGVGQLLTTRS